MFLNAQLVIELESEGNMFLDNIVNKKKVQIEEEKVKLPLEAVLKKLEEIDFDNRDFKKALNKKEISIIGEIKRASPSKGLILEDFDVIRLGEIYEEIDVDALSILTEKYFFKGNDIFLEQVRRVNSKPLLRKDFIVDPYQIYTSKLIGADAVLLIASVLKENLKEFYRKTKELNIYSIVEVHNKEELYNALEIDADIIGINNRNLVDFTVDLKTTEELIKYIPKDKTIISESGIKTPKEIKELRNMGVNAVLIGESFMRKSNNINSMKRFIYESKINS